MRIAMNAIRVGRLLATSLLVGLLGFSSRVAVAGSSSSTYTVTFDANGGTGTMAKQTIRRGVAVRLRANVFKRKGGVFVGWAKSRNGAIAYNNRQKVKDIKAGGGAITLYARWAKSKYKVRFLPNGGTGTMPVESFQYGKAKALTRNRFTRLGYMFAGWSDRPNGAVKFSDGKKVKNLTKTGYTIHLYAVWRANTYKVRFNANGGRGSMADQSFTYNAAQTLRANAFTRTGYTFVGWAKSASGTKVYNNRQSVSNLTTANGAVVSLYAMWVHKKNYCIIDLSGGTSASSYPVTYLSTPPSGGFNTYEYKTSKLVLKRIDAGSFKMGGSFAVTLTMPFYCGLFEVTQKQYLLVMGGYPSYVSGVKKPVDCVSYNDIRGSTNGAKWPSSSAVDADSFLGKLRARTGLDFDLPTEAQWEYVCRAGTTTTYSYGDSADGNYMWCLSNSGVWYSYSSYSIGKNETHEVGMKRPNPWGLYDMHGNVLEWCLDWYARSLSGGTDPKGSSSGSYRVQRGGDYSAPDYHCTSSSRSSCHPGVAPSAGGFRLVWTVVPNSNQFTVRFNANGGSGIMSDQSFTYGTAQALTANAFTRDGYTFAGWVTNADDAKAYDDKQSVSNLAIANGAIVMLYAVWVPNTADVVRFVSNSFGNDSFSGRSWSSAKRTIQAAIDTASAGDTILVADGTYGPIATDNKAIVIRSVNGAESTIIDGGHSSGCARLTYIDQATNGDGYDTVLIGFTLQNGKSGEFGGVWGGTLQDCIIRNNYIPSSNLGIGSGARTSELHNCLVVENEDSGVIHSRTYNCTIVNNGDYGCWDGYAYNCIVYGHGNNFPCMSASDRHPNCVTDDPGFVDSANGDYRLSTDSPCIDAGNNDYVTTDTDLAGNARIMGGTVDIGAYEYTTSR